ncbi:hypothetical protein IBX65_09555 [Candidatus Aerophobetes bacterium]|nr:hypothetical protein [Candidatus Aerophobetes bacterium]
MRKFKKYLVAGIAIAGFLFIFAFIRIPTETSKMVSLVSRSFKQVILREKPTLSGGFDVITSASIQVDNFSQEKS